MKLIQITDRRALSLFAGIVCCLSMADVSFAETGISSLGTKISLESAVFATNKSAKKPSGVLLVTLDTTRAKALGIYGSSGDPKPNDGAKEASAKRLSPTPVLDALARRGLHYRRAIASAPLTLPSHASLLTGRTPPGHGVHDNATEKLSSAIPTLAETLAARGYTTGAIVASRVLDRRFGLDRGFAEYDDRPPAEQVGEHGYAERTAEEVTALAIDWLSRRPKDRPFFLWVHYYDPHAPYAPPDRHAGASQAELYQGEVSLCDEQVGKLLERVSEDVLVAVVGDHGEALGEHGERAHGLFLYRSVLEVPLILAGPGVPAGASHQAPVATRRLAASLLSLLDVAPSKHQLPGPILPALGKSIDEEDGGVLSSGLIYSETVLPATAYGWSPLHAITSERHRFIMAPEPELYDFVADPEESRNLVRQERAITRRLRDALKSHEELHVAVSKAAVDSELKRDISQLGYLSGASGKAGTLDPKEGIQLLEQFQAAKEWLRQGQSAKAVSILEGLVKRNPGNVPFLTQLASAQIESGQVERGLATYQAAIARNPDYEFPRLQLARTLHGLGRIAPAEEQYRRVLELDPRLADAWMILAQMAAQRGDGQLERQLLEEAVSKGTSSAGLFLRLGQLRSSPPSADPAGALDILQQATELAPRWSLAWLIRGQLQKQLGKSENARLSLQQVLNLSPPSSSEAQQALGLLQSMSGR